MINYNDDLNHPDEFKTLSDDEQATLTTWINRNLISHKTVNQRHTSYGLKHLFERDRENGGRYITNGMFKGGMLACGYLPVNKRELNWRFKISEKSPAFDTRRGF